LAAELLMETKNCISSGHFVRVRAITGKHAGNPVLSFQITTVTAQRPTLLLLIPHLGGGGAERVTELLSRGLSPDKYEIHLGLMTQSACPSECLPAFVHVHPLGGRRVRSAALPLLRLVRTLKPDVILSGMAHLNFLVLLLRPFFPRKTRILVRQNSTASSSLQQLPRYAGLLYRLLYPAADRIVCQTEAMAVDLARESGVKPSRMQVLANPVDADAIHALSNADPTQWFGPGPHLLAIGRLSPEKGFDILLRAFSSLRLKFPGADLTIVGDGPEETVLKTIRRSLHLEASVHFPGYVLHPESYFPGATLFVLSSRQEGLPNALLEAAVGGLPIAALPSSDGVARLLDGKRGAWVANRVSSIELTLVLLRALQSIRPGQRFEHPWVEPFRMDRALQGYESLIDETLCEQRR
jgi:glycosyltransferase involved in cell wall biosynthesis